MNNLIQYKKSILLGCFHRATVVNLVVYTRYSMFFFWGGAGYGINYYITLLASHGSCCGRCANVTFIARYGSFYQQYDSFLVWANTVRLKG